MLYNVKKPIHFSNSLINVREWVEGDVFGLFVIRVRGLSALMVLLAYKR